MTSRFTALVVDCSDPVRLSGFWKEVLGYEVSEMDDDEGVISIEGPEGSGPALDFVKVPDDKVVKNRLHIDVSPRDRDQGEEVERIIALGARKVDIGQGNVSWEVLADPEGNEFCVLRTRRP